MSLKSKSRELISSKKTAFKSINPIYIPRDEQVFSWDPENMALYWEHCQCFDASPVDTFDIEATSSDKQQILRKDRGKDDFYYHCL